MQVDKLVTATIVGRLPAGCYYIGDPCYQIYPPDWPDFAEAYLRAAKEQACNGVIFAFRGEQCFAALTKNGDGICSDQHGNGYLVDAGLIGAVTIEISDTQYGIPVDFPQPFPVGADATHEYVRIGSSIIHT